MIFDSADEATRSLHSNERVIQTNVTIITDTSLHRPHNIYALQYLFALHLCEYDWSDVSVTTH